MRAGRAGSFPIDKVIIRLKKRKTYWGSGGLVFRAQNDLIAGHFLGSGSGKLQMFPIWGVCIRFRFW